MSQALTCCKINNQHMDAFVFMCMQSWPETLSHYKTAWVCRRGLAPRTMRIEAGWTLQSGRVVLLLVQASGGP